MTFHPGRESRWQYAHQTVEHIERRNCVHVCAHGADPGQPEWTEVGPGGSCGLLASVFLELPIEEMDDDGSNVTCRAFEPRALADTTVEVDVLPDGQLTIEEAP